MAEETDKKDAVAEAAGGTEAAEPVAKSGGDEAAPAKAAAPAEAAPAKAAPAKAAAPADPAPADPLANPLDTPAVDAAPVRVGRRTARVPPVGIAHIKATFNNTIVSISDVRGNVVSWSSAGKTGFKGSRKSTAFAATMVGQDAARAASAKGMHEVEVHIQGAGSGRESAVRAIQSSGLSISAIKDITPVPHNGCRQRKRRRV